MIADQGAHQIEHNCHGIKEYVHGQVDSEQRYDGQNENGKGAYVYVFNDEEHKGSGKGKQDQIEQEPERIVTAVEENALQYAGQGDRIGAGVGGKTGEEGIGSEKFPKHPDRIPKQIGDHQRKETFFDLCCIFFVIIILEKGDAGHHKKHGDGKARDGTGEEVRYLVVYNRNQAVADNVLSKIGMNEKDKNAQQEGKKLLLFPEKRIAF